MGKDIHLRFKFTDRNGSQVFDAYDADERLVMHNRLFEIRINMAEHLMPYEAKITWVENEQDTGAGTG
jgi:hypothetical protein